MRVGTGVLLVVLFGCSAPDDGADGAMSDGGSLDAGAPGTDGGSELDAQAPSDGGTSDAGVVADGGSMDGGVMDDGGMPPAPGPLFFDVPFLVHPSFTSDMRLIGDIDGDGARDAVLIDESVDNVNIQDVTFYVRRGAAFVESYRTTVTGWSAKVGAVGDFDGDALPDAAILVRSGMREWVFLHGRGDGTFERPETIEVGGDDAAFADWNDDGRMDYAVREPDVFSFPQVLVHLSAAGGGRTTIDVGSTPTSQGALLPGDFDGDGQLDLLAFPNRLFLGTYTGFAAARTLTECAMCESPAVADFDRDGRDDVAATLPGFTSDAVVVLRAAGDGTPTEAARYSIYEARSVAAGDLDADGYVDLIVMHSPLNLGGGGSALEILFGTAGLDFSADRRRFGNPAGWDEGELVEVTGDARPDLLVDGRWVLAGGAGRDLRAPRISTWQSIDTNWIGPLLERFDADARPDLVWFETTIGDARVLALQADRYLAPMTTCANTGPEPRHRFFDLDTDGDLDSIHFGASQVVSWMGSGGCAFGAAQRSAVTPLRYTTLVEDLNDDGLRDLAWRTSTTLEVAGATSAGVFGAAASTSSAAGYGYLSTGHLDADAHVDVISVGPGNDSVGVFYGDGALGFRAGPRIDVPNLSSEGGVAGDVDDDGDEDILVIVYNTLMELAVLRNDGTGALAAPEILTSVGPVESILAISDVDFDGATELVLNVGDWLRIYRLTPAGAVQLLDTPLGNSVRAVDADADGDLDLVYHESYSGRHTFSVAQNRSR